MPRKTKERPALLALAAEGDPSEKITEARPSKELWRFQAFYLEKIRNHPPSEYKGVIRQIQRMMEKGVSLEQIGAALENYRTDPWRMANPRASKNIRTFFTPELIHEWQTPRPALVKPGLVAFATAERPKPVQLVQDSDELAGDL